MKKILLVEDNFPYRKNLQKVLEKQGYLVDSVEDAITGVEYIGANTYDLVISDLMMELMDGNRFLAFVKRVQPNVRTIILTGQPTPDTEKQALAVYVDYYLSKDVRLDVFLKYVERLLHDPYQQQQPIILYGDDENIVLNIEAREVRYCGEEVSLTRKEFGLLYMFLMSKGKAISRTEFIDELWDKRFEEVDERVIDVHIKLLRKKLKTSSIVSIRGYGYKWDE